MDHLEDWQIKEIEKCANDFDYFCKTYVKITHPKRGLVNFDLYDFQKRMVAEYDKHRFNIISKFRQGGATTTTTIWCMWKCLFCTDQRIMIVSIGDREAIESGRYVKIALENLPEWLQPETGKNNDHEKEFADTNSVMWFMSPKSVRSKALSCLVIDEAAFVPRMDQLWAAMMPTLSTGGNCIVISTVNGMGNWYHQYYTGAKEGRNIFNVIDIDYTEHPEYRDPNWAPMMLAQLGEHRFAQEILRSFHGSGETYIPSKVVTELDLKTRDNSPRRMIFPEFDSNKETFRPESRKDNSDEIIYNHDYVGGALWIWKEPEPTRDYYLSVDAAEGVGKGGDNSAFHILDVLTCEQVAEFYSNNIPPHIFSQIISQFGNYYNNALVIVESCGPGLSVLSRLEFTQRYENLYYGKDNKPGLRVGSHNRNLILESLQYALCSGLVKINSRRLTHEIKTFNYNNMKKRAEAESGRHDDLVMSLALGLFVRDDLVRNSPMPIVAIDPEHETTEKFEVDLCARIRKAIIEETDDGLLLQANQSKFKDVLDVPTIKFPEYVKRSHDAILREVGW